MAFTTRSASFSLINCVSPPTSFHFQPHFIALNNKISSSSNPNRTYLFALLKNHTASSPSKNFVVNAKDAAGDTQTAVVVDKPPSPSTRFQVSRGYPTPFGATLRDAGVNFAIYSANATSATLCLIAFSDLHDVSLLL